jgi:precorrin-4 methylase
VSVNVTPGDRLWSAFHERVQWHANSLIEELEDQYPSWHVTYEDEEVILNTLEQVARKIGHDKMSDLVDAAITVGMLMPPKKFTHAVVRQGIP